MSEKTAWHRWILLVILVLASCMSSQSRPLINAPGIQLITQSDTLLLEPAWSPDGKQLTAVSRNALPEGSGGAVFVIDVATGQAKRITAFIGATEPSWSYTGNDIAYQAGNTYLINANTGEPREITKWANHAALSPNQNQIALWGPVDRHVKEREWKLSIVDLTSMREQVVVKLDADYLNPMGMSWSHVGDQIAISLPSTGTIPSNSARQWRDIYKIAISDGSIKQITNNTAVDTLNPTWSPDGRHIAYTRGNETRQTYLWVMNLDGSCPVQLLDNVGINTPAWSPDGRYIAFEYEGRLYRLDLQSEDIMQRMKGLTCKNK